MSPERLAAYIAQVKKELPNATPTEILNHAEHLYEMESKRLSERESTGQGNKQIDTISDTAKHITNVAALVVLCVMVTIGFIAWTFVGNASSIAGMKPEYLRMGGGGSGAVAVILLVARIVKKRKEANLKAKP